MEGRVGALMTEKRELQLDGLAKDKELNEIKETLSQLQAEQSRNGGAAEDMKKVKAAIGKLSKAHDSMEGVLTCMSCMEVFQAPMTYMPCGHTFCKGCVGSRRTRQAHMCVMSVEGVGRCRER